jgi:hypothetical protein
MSRIRFKIMLSVLLILELGDEAMCESILSPWLFISFRFLTIGEDVDATHLETFWAVVSAPA